MFSRLQKNFNLDFLDNKIAEEQEKQRQAAGAKASPSGSGSARRTPAGARRPNARSELSHGRSGPRSAENGDDTGLPARAPDPDDFAIGDDSADISRATTPKPAVEGPLDQAEKEAGETATTTVAAGDADGEKQNARPAEEKTAVQGADDELPLAIRQKLAKLDTLTTRYQDLLRNYRAAHARVAAIEPFEATLQEHTSLASISDPAALVEFLSQKDLQKDMAMDELKRIDAERRNAVKERDELKNKLDEAEAKAKTAFDEAAGLRTEREQAADSSEKSGVLPGAKEAKPASRKKEDEASTDDDFFSYDAEVTLSQQTEEKNALKVAELESVIQGKTKEIEELRTQLAEQAGQLQQVQSEVNERTAYIQELSAENAGNASILHDFEVTRLNLDAMENKIRVKDVAIRDLESQLRQTKDQLASSGTSNSATAGPDQETAALLTKTEGEVADLQLKLKQHQEELGKRTEELRIKAIHAEEIQAKYEQEHAANLTSAASAQREEKRFETLEGLVKTLKAQVKSAESAKLTTDTEAKDLRFKIQLMEAEADSAGKIITSLRSQEGSAKDLKRKLVEAEVSLRNHDATTNDLKRKLVEAEAVRDDAQKLAASKSGHEAAVASLRSQLKRAEKDRDAAYQMILDCGKCSVAESENNTENIPEDSETRSRGVSETTDGPSPPSTEASIEPSVDGDVAQSTDGKKKNKKKKSKAKKKPTTDGTSESTAHGEKILPSLHELIHDPSKASAIMLRTNFEGNPMLPLLVSAVEQLHQKDDERVQDWDAHRESLEEMVETERRKVLDREVLIGAKDDEIASLRLMIDNSRGSTEASEQRIADLQKEIASLKDEVTEKSAQISRLSERLKSEAQLQEQIENLKEENETLQESIIENGQSATDALHELKMLKERKEEAQKEVDELHKDQRNTRERLNEVEAERKSAVEKHALLEAELEELKNKPDNSDELKSMKEKLQLVLGEKATLEAARESFEIQIKELKEEQSANRADTDAKHKALSADVAKFKSKTSELEKELAAANQLAQTRYKDLTETRNAYNKVQPELKKLREESAELKTVKAELEKALSSIKRLEAKEKDLRLEIAEYKSQVSTKDSDLAALKDKAKKSEERGKALEESYENARKDLVASEGTRDEALEVREKLQSELRRLEDEVKKSKSALEELEKKVQKYSSEASNLRDELQLKGAQQASAQSMMDNMRDQTSELSTQMREVREAKESLEEELTDANRLLSERSREAETMRRLLADVEGRAESKVKEMRERMDLALEERDRAEDEASNMGKRRAREIEDFKNRIHDAEREATRATDARKDAERRVQDLQDRETDLQRRASQAQQELTEVRAAMAQLRDALDEGERQVRQLEKDKGDVRKLLEDKETRLERLQKSSKAMAEELRTLQQTTLVPVSVSSGKIKPSPRTSVDSSRVTSPVAGQATTTSTGKKDGIDYVYLKNILLQFLEQREKKHQMQLVPVLGMLLHFDRAEEQKWMAAISAK